MPEVRVVRRGRLVLISSVELERWLERSGARVLECRQARRSAAFGRPGRRRPHGKPSGPLQNRPEVEPRDRTQNRERRSVFRRARERLQVRDDVTAREMLPPPRPRYRGSSVDLAGHPRREVGKKTHARAV